MKPSLAIDPALLAIPSIVGSEENLSDLIRILADIGQKLRTGWDGRFLLLSSAAEILAAAGCYPALPGISDLLRNLDLLHVYTPQDINRTINDVLSRVPALEEASGVQFMVPTALTVQPEFRCHYDGPLREGLDLTLLHCALLARSGGPELIHVLVAASLQRQQLEIKADIDDLEPSLAPGNMTCIRGFTAKIWTAESANGFLADLPPATVWRDGLAPCRSRFRT